MTNLLDQPLFRDTTFNPGFRDCARIEFMSALKRTTRNWTREEIDAMAETMLNMVIQTSNTRAVTPCTVIVDQTSCESA